MIDERSAAPRGEDGEERPHGDAAARPSPHGERATADVPGVHVSVPVRRMSGHQPGL